MSNDLYNQAIQKMVASLEIPETAYAKAEARYRDLGEWFKRANGHCAPHSPHIYPQGSFRLGTVVRPLLPEDDYDLDVGCRLRTGITKESHTQKQLKALVGADLRDYRLARSIESALEEMRRCWRLKYQDELGFHMDSVPSIPEDAATRGMLKEAMVQFGTVDPLARDIAALAGAITDKTAPDYERLSPNWKVSNSEGYARWFESREALAAASATMLHELAAKRAQVDDLPVRRPKSPLQHAVQLLKRHRDVMYADDRDAQPISVIITTLAASAYQGESDVASALDGILARMGNYVRPAAPRVPNPVNPSEDFADKWADAKNVHLDLEGNFWAWLEQAQRDFRILRDSGDTRFLVEQAREKFASSIAWSGLASGVHTEPKRTEITREPARPWCSGR